MMTTPQAQPDLFGYVPDRKPEPSRRGSAAKPHPRHEKAPANPDAFRRRPQPIVQEISYTTHMGVRIDLAVLSAFAYWLGLPANRRPRVLVYHDEHALSLGSGEFVISILSVAEDLYARWYGKRFKKPLKDEHFERFYGRVKHAKNRLEEKGHLRRLGYARPDSLGVYGTRWGDSDSKLVDEILRCRPITAEGSGVNVVDEIGAAFVAEEPRPAPSDSPLFAT